VPRSQRKAEKVRRKKSGKKLVSSKLKSYAEPGSVPRAFSINRKLNHHETRQLGECVPVGENRKILSADMKSYAHFISSVIILPSNQTLLNLAFIHLTIPNTFLWS
jgi:hypothetical protein